MGGWGALDCSFLFTLTRRNTPHGFHTPWKCKHMNIGTFHVSSMMVAHTLYWPEVCGHHINTKSNVIHDSLWTHSLTTERVRSQLILWPPSNSCNGWMINCFLSMERGKRERPRKITDWAASGKNDIQEQRERYREGLTERQREKERESETLW